MSLLQCPSMVSHEVLFVRLLYLPFSVYIREPLASAIRRFAPGPSPGIPANLRVPLSNAPSSRRAGRRSGLGLRVTGRDCISEEDKALAAWLWRGEIRTTGTAKKGSRVDLWGEGFGKGMDSRDARILDRPVRPRLRLVRDDALSMDR